MPVLHAAFTPLQEEKYSYCTPTAAGSSVHSEMPVRFLIRFQPSRRRADFAYHHLWIALTRVLAK